MIRVAGLSHTYPGGAGPALEDVRLDARTGELTGLLGPNGSGKTTLLSILAGALPGDTAAVTLAGRPMASLDALELARTVAWVPQHSSIPPGFSALEVVLMGRYPHQDRWSGESPTDHRLALEALEATAALPLARRPFGQLSGGEQRRVLIARALAQQPRVLILDEAAASLDPARTREIFDLLARLAGQGLTVLSAMHDLNLAALYCRRLILLKHGRVLAQGPTARVFDPRLLMDVYETELVLAPHPRTGAPQAHLVPGADPAH